MKKFFAVVFAAIMTFSLVACGESSENQVLEEKPKQEEQVADKQEQATQESKVEAPAIEQTMVDVFIEGYNATAPTPISEAVKVDVTDQTSGHYRTEFRLGAFKDSIAKTGKIGDIAIDIVNCGSVLLRISIRTD